MTPNEFIDMLAPTVHEVCHNYNLPASVCIAQAILESGWGRYVIGNYNYFGRKYNGWGDYEEVTTQEYWDGEYHTIVDKFQSYTSLEEAIIDWCVLMREEPVYADALNTWETTWSVEDFVYAMSPIYATDPEYGNKIMETINANNLMQYDG